MSFLILVTLFGFRSDYRKDTEPTAIALPVDRETWSDDRGPSLWKDRNFLLFWFYNALASTVLFQFMGTYPLYLKDAYSFEEYGMGMLFSVNTVVIVLFELVLVSAVQNRSPLRVYAWGQFLMCIGFGLLPFAVGQSALAGYSWCVVTMLIMTIGEMLAMPLGAAHVARCSTRQTRGRYMGLYASSFSVAFLVAPLVGTVLYQVDRHLVWYCSLVVAFVLLVGLLRLAQKPTDGASRRKK